MSATISLNLIMKNEEKVLLRLLNTVYPLLDYYVVVDTGSTDASKKIVKDFFDSKNISGEIHDHPFVNFEDARNFALSKVKAKADFGFWIDCDEQLILPPNFDIAKFKSELDNSDLATTIVNSGSSRFARRNFFRTSLDFYWEGAVHEVLLCKTHIRIHNFIGIEVLVSFDGNSWSQDISKKYLAHAKILEKEVLKKGRPRDIFYLAQSYRDAGKAEKAIHWYRERVKRQDGFYEERYYSQFMIGVLYQGLKKPYRDTFFEYLKCSELDDMRAEHMLNIISLLQTNGYWQAAIAFSERAVKRFHNKIPYPERGLFLSEDVYTSRILGAHKANVRHLNVDPEREVDVCIISYAKTEELRAVTENGIRSLLLSEKNVKFNIFVVESNKEVRYDFENTKTIYTKMPFGYHRYLNLARKAGSAPYVVLCNSDLTFEPGWASEAIRAMSIDRELLSISPLCPQTQKKEDFKDYLIWYGHEVRKQLAGWCIFQKREIYDVITELDEAFEFWFCDNDYGMQLQKHGLRHALVSSSFVNHHENNLGTTGESVLEKEEKLRLTVGQEKKFRDKWMPSAIPMESFAEPSSIADSELITVAYIKHDKQIFDKFLSSSLQGKKVAEVIFTDDTKNPAANYNEMILLSKTKYILFVHEDMTFGTDFISAIYATIEKLPGDFGALGIVGTDMLENYHWAEKDKIKQVEKLDCCCILINKEHGIFFDEQTFDDFHLYVEDYCCQIRSRLDLNSYTILIDASEAKKDEGYENKPGYAKHHSATFNKLGPAWGRYYEYLEKFNKKWPN